MFSKILIANRGEIAIRVIRACKEMGVATVAVFSEADQDALHVSLADESYCIGPGPAQKSYLNMAAIITIARSCGVQAIHPGYGLLSENPKFAGLCEENGICFIGAPREVMEKMGDKAAARATMRAAGVPVIPGCDLVPDVETARREAKTIGYPLLLKARAGGGGRGIRRVNAESELKAAFASAAAEAQSAFGDGTLYMEKLLTHETQRAVSNIDIHLDGQDASARIISRSVAKDKSWQEFHPIAQGNAPCRAHIQCDSILMDEAVVRSIPEIAAYQHAIAEAEEAVLIPDGILVGFQCVFPSHKSGNQHQQGALG